MKFFYAILHNKKNHSKYIYKVSKKSLKHSLYKVNIQDIVVDKNYK